MRWPRTGDFPGPRMRSGVRKIRTMPRRRRRRPLPVLPRGTPPQFRDRTARVIEITCPRISPQWKLAAQLALVKPKPYTKSAVGARDPIQRWPRGARKIVAELLAELEDAAAAIDDPRGGENLLRIEVPAGYGVARGLALRLSRALPELWFTLSPSSYLRNGEFYRRCGKYNLELVRTTHTRLRRSIRFGFLGDVDDAIAPARNRTGQDAPAQ